MPDTPVAFLSKRKLHVRREGLTRALEIEFERTVRERTASIERRHAWKTRGRGAMFTGMWAPQTPGSSDAPVLVTGLTAAPSSSLLYSLETDAVSGVFLQEASGTESRLFHTADFRIRHVHLHPGRELIAATVFHAESLRSNIGVLPLRGSELTEVTEGDSFDQFPRWSPGDKRRIVFQSAGIGRNAAGQFAGLAPCEIHALDLDSGELAELAAESGRDLLQPRETADGALFYIRKPYESGAPDASLFGALKDALLFPIRIGQAIFQYLNFFSIAYGGKPLVTSKGAVQRQIDPRQLFVYGNFARAQHLQISQDQGQLTVPASWELVRRDPAGGVKVMARNVFAFDLAPDGSVIHSDGASIWRTSTAGVRERLAQGEMIDHVAVL